MRDELFTAERGRGAGSTASRFVFRASRQLAESLLATGFPSRKRHDSPNIHFYQEFTLRSHGVRRAGSAALDLAYVACGRMDGFWEFNLNPWDTAAGILLIEEAGGRVTDFSGGHFASTARGPGLERPDPRRSLIGLFSDMFAGRDLSPIPTPQRVCAAARRKAEPVNNASAHSHCGLRSPCSIASLDPCSVCFPHSQNARSPATGPTSACRGRVLLSASRSPVRLAFRGRRESRREQRWHTSLQNPVSAPRTPPV